jgi:hypothetical protein
MHYQAAREQLLRVQKEAEQHEQRVGRLRAYLVEVTHELQAAHSMGMESTQENQRLQSGRGTQLPTGDVHLNHLPGSTDK